MSEFPLDQGESRRIVSESDPAGDYEIKVDGGQLSIGTRKNSAEEVDDRVLEPGRPATLTKSKEHEELWAYAPNAPVTIRISKTRFRLRKAAPQSNIQVTGLESVTQVDRIAEVPSLEALQGNQSGVSTISQDVTTATNLPPMGVPDGFALAIRADPANDDDILVDGSFPLAPGDSVTLRVEDASQIPVEPASGTQTIHGIAEAN